MRGWIWISLAVAAGAGIYAWSTSSVVHRQQTAEGGAAEERILSADSEPGNWLTHGRTYNEQRHSPLADITADNIAGLGLAWFYDLPTRRGVEATPIVIDGVIYTTGSWSRVYALDARSGKLLWSWDPETPKEWARYLCCDVVNRGVAVSRGRVFVGTIDGRLVALDAGTGAVIWDVQTTPRDRPYSITGAPRVVNGKVIIGNGGAEYGVRGFVSAYDEATGEMAWRFYTVPGDPALPPESAAMEMAAKTWTGDFYWKVGGGGTAWDSMAFDPDLNLLYVGIGNGSPWSRELRSPEGGDNLFLSSIVALDADSGRLVWYYQTTPGDGWDYTATQHMILADLEIDGRTRQVLMQAPKNGFFYVLDRAGGELISAEPYVPITWATHVDMATGRPVEVASAGYRDKPVLLLPGPPGGHNWQPMSFDPDTGLVYIPAMQVPFVYGRDPNFNYRNFTWNLGVDLTLNMPPEDAATAAKMAGMLTGQLVAWDPVAQTERWRIGHPAPWNGGVLTTAGNLLIQGTGDGRLVAYRADNGERLWQARTQTGVVAAPVTYRAGGEQYIAVMAGWGGTLPLILGRGASGGKDVRNISRMLVYKLGGDGQLPPPPVEAPPPPPPALEAPKAVIATGRRLYHLSCGNCHGGGGVAGGVISDLRHMDAATHGAFQDIVRGGLYQDRGMASFADMFDEDQVEAIHAYIIKRANDERVAGTPAPKP